MARRSMGNFDNVVAMKSEKGNELGYLFWYHLPNTLLKDRKLRDVLIRSGLGEGYMPKEIFIADAFRRASSPAEMKRNGVASGVEGVFYNFMIREVYSDRFSVVKHIVREKVDSKGKRLEYNPEEAVITLDKDRKIIVKSAVQGSTAEQICEEIEERYGTFLNHHDSRTIRSMIHAVLATINPVAARESGGMYIIPRLHRDTLKQLCNFINMVSEPSSKGYKVPLVDEKENRELMRSMLMEQLKDTAEDMAANLRASELDKNKTGKALEDAKQAINDFKTYQETLSEGLEDCQDIIRIIQRQMKALFDKQTEQELKKQKTVS